MTGGFSIDHSGGDEPFGQVGDTSGQYGGPSGGLSIDRGGGNDAPPVGDLTGGTGRFAGMDVALDSAQQIVRAVFPVAQPSWGMNRRRQIIERKPYVERALPQPRPTVDNEYRPRRAEPPVTDPHMPDRAFPDPWRDPLEQPGGRMTTPMQRYNLREMGRAQGATYRGSDSGDQHGSQPGGQELRIILSSGQTIPASAIENLARLVGRGGSPNANQRAIIDAMTPAQQRAAGIFLAPDGTVRPFREVLTAAVTKAAADEPLTTNQEAALGLAFNSIPSSGARRDAINALAGSAGGEVRDNLSAAVGQSMRAARDLARKARQQTAAQQAAVQAAALRAAGVRRPGQALARLEAAGVRQDAASKLAALKAAGVTRPVSQVERLAAQGVRNPVQRLMAQAGRRDQAAATAAGTTVNKLRALRAAGVSRPAQKITRLKAAGVERPARKLAELRQAGVQRAAEKLVQLEAAGVQRPAQKIAALRQAGIERGVQKVARLKAAGVKRPVAKLNRLKQAGVKRPAQQLVQLKEAGVQRPAQKLLAQVARQPASSAKPAAQRGALGKQTQRIIRSTDQSLTFKTAHGKTRSAAQVAANAARNQAAGRPLTPNQKRLLASMR